MMDTVNYKKYLFILLLCLLLFVLEEVTYNQLQLPVHLLLPRAGVPHLRYGGAEARCDATVVTAYFEMASKHSHEQYLAWMANMLTYRDCMVVFTNQHLVE